MKKKTKWPVIAGVGFIAAFIAAMVATSSGHDQFRVEVCVTFEGRTICGKAAADKKEEAERTATSMACNQLTSGMTSTMQCEQAAPRKVTWKQ